MNFKILIVIFAFLLFFSSTISAEFVFLTDGAIIEGKIIKESNASITVRSNGNKNLEINRNTVQRIFYGDLRLDKIYVQKRDGKGFTAYKVDENRDVYTFRSNLMVNEEFTIKKSDVLFMTERNPSGLQVDGEVSADSVSLKWYPPFDPVKTYNIYVKKNKQKKYEFLQETKLKEITIKNLTSKTEYIFAVTSVDMANAESQLSNELKVLTKSINPNPPDAVKIEKQFSPKYESIVFKLSWNKAIDPDGEVVKYRIYGVNKNRNEMLSELKTCDYVLEIKNEYERIELVAVDNDSDESLPVKIYAQPYRSLSILPSVLLPFGIFSEMAETGYGSEFMFTWDDVYFENFEPGFGAGFYYLKGKDLLEERNLDFNRFFFLPLYLSAGYNFQLSINFSVKPVFSIGTALMNAQYEDDLSSGDYDRNILILEGMCKLGIYFNYKISYHWLLTLGSEYSMLIEKNDSMNCVLLHAGMIYKM
ncbi:MAG: fibronectin type III domain-containing protein [Spirochaetes bacterium]|nr:fibronectin type III domain-containing protein [Spirochaetota bacterium]